MDQVTNQTLIALKESEERYRQVVELSPDAIIIHSEGKIHFANKAAVSLYRASLEGLVGKEVIDIIHESYHNISSNRIKQILFQNKSVPLMEMKHRRMDKTIIDVEVAAAPLVVEGKTMVQAVIRDITTRKQIEEELRISKQERDLILSSITEVVVYYDCDMRINWANMSAIKSDSLSLEELIGHQCYKIWHNITKPCTGCPVMKVIETEEYQQEEFTTPNNISWSIRAYPVKDIDHNLIGVVEVARDITEKKIMENNMARLECLNIIGEIAASIGHEIRNPLTTVHGFLQMLGNKEEFLPFKEYSELMLEELNRANSIISEFLLLAKDKPMKLTNQNLNHIIESIYPLIEANALHSSKSVVLNLGNIPSIVSDQKEIRQLFWNLARNGLEAMDEGKTLFIDTYYSNNRVTLAVKDQGKGFDPSILENIGVPFNTTKEKGTGLGLAICFNIAKRHNAKIDINSSTDGTTVLIHFDSNKSFIRTD